MCRFILKNSNTLAVLLTLIALQPHHALAASTYSNEMTLATSDGVESECEKLNSAPVNAMIKKRRQAFEEKLTPENRILIARIRQGEQFLLMEKMMRIDYASGLEKEPLDKQIAYCLGIADMSSIDPTDFVDENSPEVVALNAIQAGSINAVKSILDFHPEFTRTKLAVKADIFGMVTFHGNVALAKIVANAWMLSAPKENTSEKSALELAALTTKALSRAAASGNPELVNLYLEYGADAKEAQRQGQQLLAAAIQNGSSTKKIDPVIAQRNRTDILKTLLKSGVTPNSIIEKSNSNEYRSLVLAAHFGDIEMIESLLKTGVKSIINETDSGGWSALSYAAGRKNPAMVKMLLTAGSVLKPANNGITPLIWAAHSGDVKVAQLLIDAGASPHEADKQGDQAIHYAAMNGNTDMVRLLIGLGANTKAKDKRGQLPLNLGARFPEIIKLLLDTKEMPDNDNLQDAVWGAAFSRNSEGLESLVAAGASTNFLNNLGRNVLHLAVQFDDVRLAKAALRGGVDPNKADNDRSGPLHKAIWSRSPELAKLLITTPGIDLSSPDKSSGYTPLELTASKGSIELYELLLTKGANRLVKGKNCGEPIHIASRNGNVEMIKYLIKSGANVNAIDACCKSPMDYANDKKFSLAAEALREAGGF